MNVHMCELKFVRKKLTIGCERYFIVFFFYLTLTYNNHKICQNKIGSAWSWEADDIISVFFKETCLKSFFKKNTPRLIMIKVYDLWLIHNNALKSIHVTSVKRTVDLWLFFTEQFNLDTSVVASFSSALLIYLVLSFIEYTRTWISNQGLDQVFGPKCHWHESFWIRLNHSCRSTKTPNTLTILFSCGKQTCTYELYSSKLSHKVSYNWICMVQNDCVVRAIVQTS